MDYGQNLRNDRPNRPKSGLSKRKDIDKLATFELPAISGSEVYDYWVKVSGFDSEMKPTDAVDEYWKIHFGGECPYRKKSVGPVLAEKKSTKSKQNSKNINQNSPPQNIYRNEPLLSKPLRPLSAGHKRISSDTKENVRQQLPALVLSPRISSTKNTSPRLREPQEANEHNDGALTSRSAAKRKKQKNRIDKQNENIPNDDTKQENSIKTDKYSNPIIATGRTAASKQPQTDEIGPNEEYKVKMLSAALKAIQDKPDQGPKAVPQRPKSANIISNRKNSHSQVDRHTNINRPQSANRALQKSSNLNSKHSTITPKNNVYLDCLDLQSKFCINNQPLAAEIFASFDARTEVTSMENLNQVVYSSQQFRGFSNSESKGNLAESVGFHNHQGGTLEVSEEEHVAYNSLMAEMNQNNNMIRYIRMGPKTTHLASPASTLTPKGNNIVGSYGEMSERLEREKIAYMQRLGMKSPIGTPGNQTGRMSEVPEVALGIGIKDLISSMEGFRIVKSPGKSENANLPPLTASPPKSAVRNVPTSPLASFNLNRESRFEQSNRLTNELITRNNGQVLTEQLLQKCQAAKLHSPEVSQKIQGVVDSIEMLDIRQIADNLAAAGDRRPRSGSGGLSSRPAMSPREIENFENQVETNRRIHSFASPDLKTQQHKESTRDRPMSRPMSSGGNRRGNASGGIGGVRAILAGSRVVRDSDLIPDPVLSPRENQPISARSNPRANEKCEETESRDEDQVREYEETSDTVVQENLVEIKDVVEGHNEVTCPNIDNNESTLANNPNPAAPTLPESIANNEVGVPTESATSVVDANRPRHPVSEGDLNKMLVKRNSFLSDLKLQGFKLKKTTPKTNKENDTILESTSDNISSSQPAIISDEVKVQWDKFVSKAIKHSYLRDQSDISIQRILGMGKYSKVYAASLLLSQAKTNNDNSLVNVYDLSNGHFEVSMLCHKGELKDHDGDGQKPLRKLTSYERLLLMKEAMETKAATCEEDGNTTTERNSIEVAMKVMQYTSTISVSYSKQKSSEPKGEENDKISLKLPPPRCLEEAQRELDALSVLHHCNIIAIKGIVIAPVLGFAVEYMNLGDLASSMKDMKWQSITPIENRSKIVVDVASALFYMHTMNFVHRDIKPHNILLCGENGNITAKIGDFGSAVHLAANQMLTEALGTSGYTAPEILREESYSYPADIFSFAVVVWDVYCNPLDFSDTSGDQYEKLFANPFTGKDPEAILDLIESGVRPFIYEPMFPEQVTDLLQLCWEPQPQNRPDSHKIFNILLTI